MANVKKKVVYPTMRFVGDKEHALEKLFDGDPEKIPEIKSIGYMRLPRSNNEYVSFVITSKGREIIKIEVDQPNTRSIVEESAKILFVSTFMNEDV